MPLQGQGRISTDHWSTGGNLGQVTKNNSAKKVVPPQGQGLDLSVAFTQVHLTLAPPGLASECVPMNFFSLHQTRLKAMRRTSILSMAIFTSTSKMRLKVFHFHSLITWTSFWDFSMGFWDCIMGQAHINQQISLKPPLRWNICFYFLYVSSITILSCTRKLSLPWGSYHWPVAFPGHKRKSFDNP